MGGQNNGKSLKGVDTFVWSRADVVAADGRQAGFDRILDFSSSDTFDFTELFSNTHPLDLEAVIRVTETKTGTVIAADLGDGQFYDVVLLSGVHGVALDDLVAHHQIVV